MRAVLGVAPEPEAPCRGSCGHRMGGVMATRKKPMRKSLKSTSVEKALDAIADNLALALIRASGGDVWDEALAEHARAYVDRARVKISLKTLISKTSKKIRRQGFKVYKRPW